MANKIFYDDNARRRLLGGAQILYEAVKTTMGPKGRNVVIGRASGAPTVTHDGVTVAKSVTIPTVDDHTLGYGVGADLIKQAANKMNDVAGDGTTTVTVLTYHILNEANKLIAAGHNPMLLRKGMEAAGKYVQRELDKLAEDIRGNKSRVAEVATISAGDEEIGTLIADVIEKVGNDAVVTVEEGRGLALESEVVEGFTFDRGFVSPYMATNAERMEAVYDKPAIAITDKKIASVQELLPLLEKLAGAGSKELVLIAEDVEGDALSTLILNRLKGVFNTTAIKAPAFGDRRKEILEDIAILTGAQVITEERGLTFSNVDLNAIGTARKVIVTKDHTTIIEGGGDEANVNDRIQQMTTQIAATNNDYDKENLEKRRAALGGKVAVIRVGGQTETEIEEKKYRVDDAVAAVRAALKEGIVPGGGITLRDISRTMSPDPEDHGARLLQNALEYPWRVILENADLKPDAYSMLDTGLGLDVNNPAEPVDMKAAGVVDPVVVTKQAVENAVSIAGTAMTMGAFVVGIPDESNAATPEMGGMMEM